ncbi:MAG: RidA family protein [Spirochaetes bacterium]|nr:MAG: RidA family protein [Spirochaetota bacterium]
MSVTEKLKELGISIPQAPKPVAAYVPAVTSGDILYTSGQVPVTEGKLQYEGKVGTQVTLEQARTSARICAINSLAAAKSILGDLDKIDRVLQVHGFVNAAEGFYDFAKVIDGASLFLKEIFGEAGEHARFAVGAAGLPLNAPVEIEIVYRIK